MNEKEFADYIGDLLFKTSDTAFREAMKTMDYLLNASDDFEDFKENVRCYVEALKEEENK